MKTLNRPVHPLLMVLLGIAVLVVAVLWISIPGRFRITGYDKTTGFTGDVPVVNWQFVPGDPSAGSSFKIAK